MQCSGASFALCRHASVEALSSVGSSVFAGNTDPISANAQNMGQRSCMARELPSTPLLAAPAIRRDALVRHPHAVRQLAPLPEHIDRHAAARIPVAADAEPFRLEQVGDPLADADGAI